MSANGTRGTDPAQLAALVDPGPLPDVVVDQHHLSGLGGELEGLRLPRLGQGGRHQAAEGRCQTGLVAARDDLQAASLLGAVVEGGPDLEEGIPVDAPKPTAELVEMKSEAYETDLPMRAR